MDGPPAREGMTSLGAAKVVIVAGSSRELARSRLREVVHRKRHNGITKVVLPRLRRDVNATAREKNGARTFFFGLAGRIFWVPGRLVSLHLKSMFG